MNILVKLLKQNYHRIYIEYECEILNDNIHLFTKDQQLMTRKCKSLDIQVLDGITRFHTSCDWDVPRDNGKDGSLVFQIGTRARDVRRERG